MNNLRLKFQSFQIKIIIICIKKLKSTQKPYNFIDICMLGYLYTLHIILCYELII